MTDKKVNEACYQCDHLWTGRKAIRELNKITYIPTKGVIPCLAKQAL